MLVFRALSLRIHWLARKSASVYGSKGHLHCAFRCRYIYSGNELSDLRAALPKKLPVGTLDTCAPLSRFAFKRLDYEALVLH